MDPRPQLLCYMAVTCKERGVIPMSQIYLKEFALKLLGVFDLLTNGQIGWSEGKYQDISLRLFVLNGLSTLQFRTSKI